MAGEGLFRRFLEEGFAAPEVVWDPVAFPTRSHEEVQSRITACDSLIGSASEELHRLSWALDGMPHADAIADADGVVVHTYATSPDLIAFHRRPLGADMLAAPEMRVALSAGRSAISEGPADERTTMYVALQAPDGLLLGFLAFGCMRDRLTEYVVVTVLQTAKLIAATSQLNQTRRHHERAIGVIGHELRQPLSALIAALDVMGRNLQPAQPRAFEIAKRQSTHVVRLVESLLDLSRLLSGKLRMTQYRADVRTIVSHAIETVRSDIESRRQTLHVHLPDQPVWCLVDPSRMQQVLVNLLTNAHRYSDDGGEIRVKVTGGARVEISVNDNGPGIEPGARDQIFQPFRQQAETGHGLGLGLPISRRIVEMHAGSLDVEVGDGGIGSRFVVRLPAAEENFGEPDSASVGS